MKKAKQFILKHEKLIVPIILFVISILLILPLFKKGYLGGHDSSYHLNSIMGMAESSDGKIIPRLFGEYGYGEGIFYPPLSHTVSTVIYTVIKNFGLTVFTAAKLSHLLFLFLSGLMFYIFIRKVNGEKKVGSNLVSSIVYMGTGYHIASIIIRDAMAETALYMFLPIVALSLYYLAKKEHKKFLPIFIIGVSGCILSHLVMTLFFGILCFLFVLYKRKVFFTKKNIIYVAIGMLVTFLMTCSFIVPMMQHKIFGDYRVFGEQFTSVLDKNDNILYMDYAHQLAPVSSYYNGLVISNNLIAFVLSIYAIVIYWKKRKTDQRVGIILFCVVMIVLFSILISGNIEFLKVKNWPLALKMIQFPWRLLTFSALFVSIAVGLSLNMIDKKNLSIACVLILASVTYNSVAGWGLCRTNYPTLSTIQNAQNTEYFPSEIKRGWLEFYQDKSPVVRAIPSDGEAVVSNKNSKTPSMDLDVSTEKPVELVFPRFFYFGYEAQIDYGDGNIEKVNAYNNEGYVAVHVDHSAHVALRYTGGTVLRVTRAIAATTAVSFAGYCGYAVISNRKALSKKHRK